MAQICGRECEREREADTHSVWERWCSCDRRVTETERRRGERGAGSGERVGTRTRYSTALLPGYARRGGRRPYCSRPRSTNGMGVLRLLALAACASSRWNTVYAQTCSAASDDPSANADGGGNSCSYYQGYGCDISYGTLSDLQLKSACPYSCGVCSGEWRQPTCAWVGEYSFANCCSTEAFTAPSGAPCTWTSTTYGNCCTDLTPAPPPPAPPSGFTCTSPPSHLFTASGFYAGYIVTAENSLEANTLDVEVTCASNRYYSGTAVAAECDKDGGEYVLSGCQPIVCKFMCLPAFAQ